VLLALATLPALNGCVYRMNIQQGNYLENSTLAQLQVGMTRSQVRYLLGTPMVPDAFDNDRWDYLYYLRKGRLTKPEQRHLTVYFEEDKVARVDRHELNPPAAAKNN
jgi:outer membrane protein assembly factor BamE